MRAPRHQRPSTTARTFRLTIRFSMPPSRCPVRVRVLSRGIAMAERDAASCGFANARRLPGGSEPRPPPLRADARSSQTVKRTLLHPARDRANNRRGGAPRGERPASWDVRRPLAPAGHHRWPADGCRCTRAPVGAPLPSLFVRGHWQTSEELHASREGSCVSRCCRHLATATPLNPSGSANYFPLRLRAESTADPSSLRA